LPLNSSKPRSQIYKQSDITEQCHTARMTSLGSGTSRSDEIEPTAKGATQARVKSKNRSYIWVYMDKKIAIRI
jgi:hypothetical protein